MATRPENGVEACAGPLEQAWRRPGALSYALVRLRGLVRCPVSVYEPDPSLITIERDVAVTVRDGTVLRANVFRPIAEGRAPVLLSAHPYGKDNLPVRRRRGYRVNAQYRVLRQTGPLRFSSATSWEAPDPAWWVEQGYAVVNADLRGSGASAGTGALLSNQEGEDVCDIVEWAAAQPWSSGRVGMLGVSYLAISQYKAAALHPAGLEAICPWEGFTDAYRDLMRPGGIREKGFTSMWGRGIRKVRLREDLIAEQQRRPLRDEWWQAIVPDLPAITTPMLVCASFSDNNLHTRGSFRAYERAGSAEKFAYTHRSGKWTTFYSAEARAAQLAFFDRYLKGAEVAAPPPVRLEVRDSRDRVVAVRAEQEWPLARTQWTPLHLGSDGALHPDPARAGCVSFPTLSRSALFSWTFREDTELSGPMALRVWVESPDADDLDLFAGVEMWRKGRYVPFEGSYGFGRDRVTTGWQRVSLRALDAGLSTPCEPVPAFLERQPLTRGAVVPVDVSLGPSATLFHAGDLLRLVVGGRWLWPSNPLTGQFPARYERGPKARCILHWGPERPSHLLVPVVPEQSAGGVLQERQDL